jgi:4-amino-4-deoxy-L-arabinose transferase-like glycosyltransferase
METTAPTAAAARPKTAGWSSAKRLRAALAHSSWDARWTAAAVLAFLGVTVWWLTQDTRLLDFYSAIQTRFAFIAHDQIASGHLASPFTVFGKDNYPPLGRLIGALGLFIGGASAKSVILALNIVFVPALAAGCYGVGRLVAGTRAGLLAALFALGAPMIVSEAHGVYPDPLQASMIALSVLGILASRRFEHVGTAALAGAATGLAFLTKETTPIFLAGLLAVVLLRGGWRNWRGILAYCAAVVVIAAPWYLYHVGQLGRLTSTTNTPPAALARAVSEATPGRLSFNNLSWYFWDAANVQLRLALLLLLLAGTVAAVRSSIRDRSPANLYPELLGGALVSYVGITMITIKDPRYSLPALVYMAVLGTAWITQVTPRLRPWLTAAVLVIVAASFASVAFGLGGSNYRLRVTLPGPSPEEPQGERALTLYATTGWLQGPPETRDGDLRALMRGLHRAGVRGAAFCCGHERPEVGIDGGAERVDFNVSGLVVAAKEAGIHYVEQQAELGPRNVFVMARAPVPGLPPCQTLRDGTGIYVVLGSPLGKPFTRYAFICPGRTPKIYGYGAGSAPEQTG